MRRKDVNDPVDRFGRGARVQGAKHQVPGFRRGHGEADRLKIAHLAHQNNVGVLAQCRAQRVGKGKRVRPDLALVDKAFLRLVHEFDRILNGKDVAVLVLV